MHFTAPSIDIGVFAVEIEFADGGGLWGGATEVWLIR